MRLLFTNLFLLTTLCFSFAQSTYYINLSGDDNNSGLSESDAWRSMTYAASSSSPVSPGDVVYIKAGDYGNENVVFDTNGTAANPIKFIGYQNIPEDNPNLNYAYGDELDETIMPLLDGNDRTTGIGIVMHNREYIELSNIQIKNYSIGLYAWKGKHLKVKNIIAMYLGDTSLSYNGKGIVFGSQADGNVVEDCVVYNACAEGLSINGDNHIVKNCRIYADDNSTGHYSAMDYYIHVGGNNNLIENCFVERIGDLDHGGHGINLKGNCENNIIRNCTGKGMGYNGFQLRHRGTKNNLIENCHAINCGYTIRDGASDNIIRNCKSVSANHAVLLLDTTEDEDAQYPGRNNVFENCIFQNTVNNAINFWHYGSAAISVADSNNFVNCIFDGGAYLFNADRENYAHKMTNCIVTNVQNFVGSSYFGNPFPMNFDFEYSYFYNNGFTTPAGINVYEGNPQFVDAANNDYHLTESSPCIDAGDNTNVPAIDYDGNQRPYNGIIDIGAYEYTPCLKLNLKVFLEGSFNENSIEMSTLLANERKILPGQTPDNPQTTPTPAGQPYQIAPWNYLGQEGSNFTNADYSSDVVDWVLISIRTSIDKANQVAQVAGLVLKDGTVQIPVDCELETMNPGPFYIVIEHRSHMGIMSPTTVLPLNGELSYDFSTQDSYKTPASVGQKQLGNIWAMLAGDINQATDVLGYDINGADKGTWIISNGLFDIYTPADVNLDGDINGADKAIWLGNNGNTSAVPK